MMRLYPGPRIHRSSRMSRSPVWLAFSPAPGMLSWCGVLEVHHVEAGQGVGFLDGRPDGAHAVGVLAEAIARCDVEGVVDGIVDEEVRRHGLGHGQQEDGHVVLSNE